MFAGASAGSRSILGRLTIDMSGVVGAQRVNAAAANSFNRSWSRTGRVVDRSAQQMGQSFRGLANQIRLTERAMSSFAQTRVGRDLALIEKTTGNIANNFKLISLGAGLAAGRGAKEAFGLFRANELLVAMSKNQDQVNERQAQFRALADRTGQSYLTILEASERLLPTIGRTNIDLSQTLLLAQRLALMDPAQGVQGAAIALREALGGEARSLAFRFEIPRFEVRKAINEAQGDPQAMIDALDRLIDRVGISNEAFLTMQKNGINVFNRLKDTVRNAMAVAFTPLLMEILIPGAKMISDFLQAIIDTNPELLNWVALILVGTTAIAPLLFGLSKAIGLFVSLKTVLAANVLLLKGFVATAAGAGVLAIAAGIGIGGGLAIVKALADSGAEGGSFERIRQGESVGDVIGNTFKQLLLLAIQAIDDFGTALARAVFIIRALGDEIGTRLGGTFEALRLLILQAGNDLAMALTELSIGILDSFPFLGNADEQRNSLAIQAAFGEELQTRLREIASMPSLGLDNIVARSEEAFPNTRDLTRTAAGLLFPGLISETEDNLSSLNKFFNQLLAGFQNHVMVLNQTIEAIAEINDEFDKEIELRRSRRGLADKRTGENLSLSEFRRDRDEARKNIREINEFNRSQIEKVKEAEAEIKKARKKAGEDRLQKLREFQLQEVRRLQDHQRRLTQIREDARVRIQRAASQLDAVAVFEARNDRNRRINEEKTTFGIQQQRRQTDFETEMALFIRQSEARIAALINAEENRTRVEAEQFALRRALAIQDAALRRQDTEEDRRIARDRLLEDREIEDQLLEEQRKKSLNKLREDLEDQSASIRAVNNSVISLASTASTSMFKFFKSVADGAQNFGDRIGNFINDVGGAIGGIGNNVKNTVNKFLPIFDSGGTPPVGSSFLSLQPELITLSQPARVMSPQQTRSMLGGGSGGGGINLTIENLSIPIDGLGNMRPEDAANVVKEGLVLALQDLMGNG